MRNRVTLFYNGFDLLVFFLVSVCFFSFKVLFAQCRLLFLFCFTSDLAAIWGFVFLVKYVLFWIVLIKIIVSNSSSIQSANLSDFNAFSGVQEYRRDSFQCHFPQPGCTSMLLY